MNNRGGPPNRGRGSYRGGGAMNGNYQERINNFYRALKITYCIEVIY